MTDKEKTLAEKYLQLKVKQKKLGEQADSVLDMLKAEAPHKVGEMVRWVTPKHTENKGSMWHPNYVMIPEKVHEAVLYDLRVSVSNYSGIYISYLPEFRPIKKDGRISQNKVCLYGDEPRWTGEQYQAPA